MSASKSEQENVVMLYLRSSLADLRTEVERRANDGVRLIKRVRQNARDAKVANLQHAVVC